MTVLKKKHIDNLAVLIDDARIREYDEKRI